MVLALLDNNEYLEGVESFYVSAWFQLFVIFEMVLSCLAYFHHLGENWNDT